MASVMLLSIFCVCFTAKATDSNEQHISQSITSKNNFPTTKKESYYGFIISVNSDQSVDVEDKISCLVNNLLKNDLEVYWLTSDYSKMLQGLGDNDNAQIKSFRKGSFIVPFSNDPSVNVEIQSIVYAYYYLGLGEHIYKLLEPLVDVSVYKLVKPKIAYHNGKNVSPEGYTHCMKSGGFPEGTPLDWNDIPKRLKYENGEFNVFIWGGKSDELNFDKTIDEWNKAVDAVKDFINAGGGYVGSCLGGYVASKGIGAPVNFLSSLFDQFLPDYFIGANCLTWKALPGWGGNVIVKVSDGNNPVTYGVSTTMTQPLYGGPVFYNLGRDTKKILGYQSVCDDFLWDDNIPKFNKEIWKMFTFRKASASAIEAKIGSGKLVAYGTHPEFVEDPYRRIESDKLRLVYNSIFYVISQGPLTKQFSVTSDLNVIDVDAHGPYDGYEGELINFKGSALNGESPYSWCWDFSDGSISTEQNPSHSFEKSGDYKVVLSLTDKNGDLGISTTDVKIYESLYFYIADFIHAEKGENQEYSVFILGGCAPYYFEWDFNIHDNIKVDKATYDGKTNYVYSKTGVFYGKVTCTDKRGSVYTRDFIVTVSSANINFEAFLTAKAYPTFEMFVDISTVTNPPTTYTWVLSYGDGTPDDKDTFKADINFYKFNREHTYSSAGKYYALFTVTDDHGNIYYYMTSVQIDSNNDKQEYNSQQSTDLNIQISEKSSSTSSIQQITTTKTTTSTTTSDQTTQQSTLQSKTSSLISQLIGTKQSSTTTTSSSVSSNTISQTTTQSNPTTTSTSTSSSSIINK